MGRREGDLDPTEEDETKIAHSVRRVTADNRSVTAASLSPRALLRTLLADSRRAGLTFDEPWPEDVADAVATAPSWRDVFESQRDIWRACWHREGHGSISLDALDDAARVADGASVVA